MKSQITALRNASLKSILIILTSILFITCKKTSTNLNNSDGNGILFNNSKIVKSTIHGQVLDENGQPIIGANVNVGSNSTLTDSIGFFLFKNVESSEHATLISVTKSGYFDGFRTIMVKDNSSQKTSFKMMRLGQASILKSIDGGTINAVNGGSVIFQPNCFINKTSGQIYNGDVKVYAKRINPTSESLLDIMPGSLRGIDLNNYEKILTTYGMIGVELFDVSGNKLQLQNGIKAKVVMPIDIANNAPNDIPLWHFNEINGMWVQEGSALKTANGYESDVSHFSFWNFGFPGNYVQINTSFVDQNGLPLANYYINVTTTSSIGYSSGYSDNNGIINGFVPENSNLILTVYNKCDTNITSIYTQSITTNTSNLNLGVITVNLSNMNYLTLNGIAYDCSNNPITNSIVKIVNGINYNLCTTDNLGNYQINLVSCSLPITFQANAYDNTNLETGAPINIVINSVGSFTNNLFACGTLTAFFNYSENNNGIITNYNYNESDYNIIHNGTAGDLVYINNLSNDTTLGPLIQFDHFNIIFNNLSTQLGSFGTYDIPTTAVSIIPGMLFNLTYYGPIGDWISGSFSIPATTWMSGDTNKSASGSFRVKRVN
jgi:hypothetical protein